MPVTPIGLGRLILGGLRRIIDDIIRQSRRTRATVLNPRLTRAVVRNPRFTRAVVRNPRFTRAAVRNPRTTRARVPGYES